MLGRALIALLLIIGSSSAESASFQIVYNTTLGDDDKNARAFIEEEGITQTVSELLNDEFELRDDLSLFLGSDQGPLFDETKNEIYMPYGFVFEVAGRFKRDPYSQTNADIYEVTRDAYLHAILHEVAHALFAMYDLKTSGNTEKAVDALAILLLLRYYENGGSIVINAAELFVDDSRATPESAQGRDFWSEHDLDRRSYTQAICLVYGSDPQRYSTLRERSQFLQIRDEECAREYRRQVNAWFRVLGSFLKKPPPE